MNGKKSKKVQNALRIGMLLVFILTACAPVATATPAPTAIGVATATYAPTETPAPTVPAAGPCIPVTVEWTNFKPLVAKIPIGIATGESLLSMNETELEVFMRLLCESRVTDLRLDAEWNQIEKTEGVYDFTDLDRVIAAAEKYGVELLLVLTGYAPEFGKADPACDGGQYKFLCAPDAMKFARFARATAEHANAVDQFEVWNEENIEVFWFPQPDAKDYADLLKATYIAIKEVRPDAIIVSGGLSPAGDDGINIPPRTFMRQLRELGATDYLDKVGYHPYTYPLSPGFDKYQNNWQVAESIYSDIRKPFVLSEYGAPTCGSGWSHGVNSETEFTYGEDYSSLLAQADMAWEAIFFASEYGWVDSLYWYSIRDDRAIESGNPESCFGLLNGDGSRKEVDEYNAYRGMTAYDIFVASISAGK